jgi:competence protein ComEA
MSSSCDHSPAAVPADAQPSHRRPPLPWSWPEGARILLAVLAISVAIGLAVAGRDRPRRMAAGRQDSELLLDPNTATPEALSALPHLGPTLARRIAEARADGPFRSLEDVQARVRGIGPATLAQIAPHLRIDARAMSRPVLDAAPIAIADAGTGAAAPARRSSRKPPASRTRKTRSALVQLTPKADAQATP